MTRDRLLRIGSATGYGIGLAALIILLQHDGGYAYDARSYWLAGRHVLDGQPLYEPVAIDAVGPFRYPPLFAQLWLPLALLPELAFAWAWRFFCFLCLRYLAGSWRNVGLWLLIPLSITELSAANVTLPVGAAILASLRGRSGLAAWAGALKYGGFLLIPYLWWVRPSERRGLVLGLATLGAACGVSFLLAPDDWGRYLQSLGWQAVSPLVGGGLIALLPTAATDFGLRLGVGVGITILALLLRSDRLAYVASVATVPTLWLQRLVPMLAVFRLPPRPEVSEVAGESRP